jgi:ribosomal protein S18 acetylase RimI-like enzyme
MIRPAVPPDIPSMVELLRQLFAIEADFDFSAERQQQGLELLLASPAARVVVAERDARVVGMATAQLVISTAEGGPSLLVEDLVVIPHWQNCGIGSSLLDALAVWGNEHGASRMQLLADRTNTAALHFYNTRGWRATQLICLRNHSTKEGLL